MGVSITYKDENTQGLAFHHSTLWIETARISVRELIAQRVLQEVQLVNEQNDDAVFHTLVQPTDTERNLNGFKFKRRKVIDAQKQIALAEESFESNGFFILIDDIQVESLDEVFHVTSSTQISFLKLVPIVGG